MEAKIGQMPEVASCTLTYATKQLRVEAAHPLELLPRIQQICASIESEVTVTPRAARSETKCETQEEGGDEGKRDLVRIIMGAAALVIGKVLGRRTLAAYLGAIVAGAVGFGLAIDYLLPAAWFVPSGAVHAACHGEAGYSWVEVASSALLAALLAYALMKRFIHRKNDTSMTKQIYRVGGMSCNHCKASVEKNLALLPSVTAVEVDLTAGTVAVEGTADAAGIQKVIEELGFEYKGRA